MYRLRIALVLSDSDLEAQIGSGLQGLPVQMATMRVSDTERHLLVERIERMRADVVLLEADAAEADTWELVRSVKNCSTAPALIVISRCEESATILGAFRAGVDEFLSPPFEPYLGNVLEQIAAQRHQHREQLTAAKVLGFLSAKGGCGATTIACHMADQLSRFADRRILLLDLDLLSGVIHVAMKTEPVHSVKEALQNINRLDASYWERLVCVKSPNLHVLSAPALSVRQHDVPHAAIPKVLRFVRSMYDWILVDLGRSANPAAMAGLPEIDYVMLTTTPELFSLHQARGIIAALTGAGYGQDQIRLILNQTPKDLGMSLDQLGETLGSPIYAALPEDYFSLYRAYSEGKLLPGNAPLMQALAGMIARMPGLAPVQEPKRKPRPITRGLLRHMCFGIQPSGIITDGA